MRQAPGEPGFTVRLVDDWTLWDQRR